MLSKMMDQNARRKTPAHANDVMTDALIGSALSSAQLAEQSGLAHDRIIISAKVSAVPDLLVLYRKLASQCDYPLHLGLTEAGMGTRGIIASTAGLALLLGEGIGDTIRVSLTPRPDGDRCEEVNVARQILQSLELRDFFPQVTACPGCGRTSSNLFRQLAAEIDTYISARIAEWRIKYPGVEQLKIAVMGCVVNGPGESKHADIGISLPGSGEKPKAPVYIDGRHFKTLQGENLSAQFMQMIEDYIEKRFSKKGNSGHSSS
jgi:(E)-4-hydroxy-3-methylbut-2-enyl-diphosphate synthase